MPTTVDELKALYVHLGGSAGDVKNLTLIPELIAAISTLDIASGDMEAITHAEIAEIVDDIEIEDEEEET